jgi:hypothetical protein
MTTGVTIGDGDGDARKRFGSVQLQLMTSRVRLGWDGA